MQTQSKYLFGLTALEMGFIDSSKLSHALSVQQTRNRLGEYHSRLGEICEDLGYLTRDQVQAAIDRSRVHQLPSYLRPIKEKAAPPSVPNVLQLAGQDARAPSASSETSSTASPSASEATLNPDDLISRYQTAIEQIKEFTKIIQDLRIENKSLALRVELAENEAESLRRRLQGVKAEPSGNGWLSRR